MEFQLREIFSTCFKYIFFFQIKCVKLKLDNWVTEVFFAGFDLLAWTNLLNLIGYQHLMFDFHWLFNCPITSSF